MKEKFVISLLMAATALVSLKLLSNFSLNYCRPPSSFADFSKRLPRGCVSGLSKRANNEGFQVFAWTAIAENNFTHSLYLASKERDSERGFAGRHLQTLRGRSFSSLEVHFERNGGILFWGTAPMRKEGLVSDYAIYIAFLDPAGFKRGKLRRISSLPHKKVAQVSSDITSGFSNPETLLLAWEEKDYRSNRRALRIRTADLKRARLSLASKLVRELSQGEKLAPRTLTWGGEQALLLWNESNYLWGSAVRASAKELSVDFSPPFLLAQGISSLELVPPQ